MSPDSVTTAHYKSDLSRLTALIGGALAFFGAILVAVVAYSGWSANEAATERERQQIENALDDGVSRVLNEQKSIAWWDDAVTHLMASPLDAEWADIEMGAFFNETYGHDEIFILNAENEPVYAYIEGERTEPEAAFARHSDIIEMVTREARVGDNPALRQRALAFERGQGNYRELLGATNAAWSAHVLNVDGAPAVVAAITIVPHSTATLLSGSPYLLISIVRIDPEFMGQIGAGLLLPDLNLRDAPVRGADVVSEAFAADNGAALGYMTWTTQRPGAPLLMFILPLVVIGVFGAGVTTAVMIRRLKNASVELADREEQSRYEALHDSLCGLPNRAYFVERLEEHLDGLVKTRNNQRVIVAYIDVDRFKDVNDTLGHQAGDALIMAVAARLGRFIGPDDFLARFGGDEFAVMRRANSPEESADLTERLRRAFDEGFDVHGQAVRMTASIGISMAPDHGVTPEELMRHADIALYQGKNQGRDRAMFFCAEMAAEVEQRREVELELHAALEANDLNLHYQPVVSCASGAVIGVEALLRWRHPVKGDISPGVFVPIAEEAGLMPALGAFVLERAFEEAKLWPEIEVSINLSPVQFKHVDLPALLAALIKRHDVDPGRIVLEVTEGVLMESSDRNRHTLDAVRAMGFKIALDDFGTGYSSLRYLSDFRFDKIKIDRAFVTDVHERKRALTIIQSVVTLGRGLGMDVVAEGVETEAEASVMRLVGVNELQGFYFSKAVPADQVAGLVEAFAGAGAKQNAAPSSFPETLAQRR
ncbi:MAG: putative bifunctional diguanylate cyclase/phosphodiesterase [Hyphomonadaceae bacterium]